MRISPIQNYNVNFGYDKKLNNEVKETLKTHPNQQWAKGILSLNNYCNQLENKIRQEEKKQVKDTTLIDDFVDIFLSCKQTLTGYLVLYLEDLKFADREYDSYLKECEEKDLPADNWRHKICQRIETWRSIDKIVGSDSKTDKSLESAHNEDEDDIDDLDDDSIINRLGAALSGAKKQSSLLEEYTPSVDSPKGFCDVAGMSDLKDSLKEGIIQCINNPEQAKLDFEEYGIRVPKTLLLYGPPGCGKTYITKALASEIDTPMYLLNISKAGSHYINLTSKNIKDAFDSAIAIGSKSEKPCIVFMDEIDSLGFDRSSNTFPEDIKQVATMLQSIDQAKEGNVILIGATNKYNILDPAIRRRFESKVFVGTPDKDAIIALLKKELGKMKGKGEELLSSDDKLNKIAEKLDGYSNSSICIITHQAAVNARKRDRANISVIDFEKAIEKSEEEKPNIKEYQNEQTNKKNKIGF